MLVCNPPALVELFLKLLADNPWLTQESQILKHEAKVITLFKSSISNVTKCEFQSNIKDKMLWKENWVNEYFDSKNKTA